MLNTVLLTAATKIMQSTAPSQFTITARFLNASNGSTFSFYPFKINSLTINRDYAENFADEIDLDFMVSPKDYALLQDQGQNLLCILTMTYMNRFGKAVPRPAPIQVQYNVMISNSRDIRHEVPDIQSYTIPSERMVVRLVEKTVYDLRQTRINTIYQNLTVTQAIYAASSTFGIKKIHLVPPDNTHIYDHIDIGSYQSMSSLYPFLQSKIGVYQKGINAYLTGGVLYVYPAFETDPTYDKTAMFYQVDTGRYAGMHIFHSTDTNSVSIVNASQPKVIDLSVAGAENIGTGFIFLKASRLTDGLTTVDSATGAQYTNDQSLSISLASNRTVVKDSNNMFHIHGTDNPFPQMALLISHQASLMRMKWEGADPFLIDPPQKVIYNYDRNGSMVKKTGMFEKARYVITNIQKIHDQDIFGCVGDLTLRLSPNETKVI